MNNQNEIEESNPNTIALKRSKHLGIQLTKEVKTCILKMRQYFLTKLEA